MTAIKITPANAARIQAMLAEANGRATSHTIRACSEVIAIADDAEARLAALPKCSSWASVVNWRQSRNSMARGVGMVIICVTY